MRRSCAHAWYGMRPSGGSTISWNGRPRRSGPRLCMRAWTGSQQPSSMLCEALAGPRPSIPACRDGRRRCAAATTPTPADWPAPADPRTRISGRGFHAGGARGRRLPEGGGRRQGGRDQARGSQRHSRPCICSSSSAPLSESRPGTHDDGNRHEVGRPRSRTANVIGGFCAWCMARSISMSVLVAVHARRRLPVRLRRSRRARDGTRMPSPAGRRTEPAPGPAATSGDDRSRPQSSTPCIPPPRCEAESPPAPGPHCGRAPTARSSSA